MLSSIACTLTIAVVASASLTSNAAAELSVHHGRTEVEEITVIGIEQEVCAHSCPGSEGAINCTKHQFRFDHCYGIADFSSDNGQLATSDLFKFHMYEAASTVTQFRPYTCTDRRRSVTEGGHPLPPHFTFRFAFVPANESSSPTSECYAHANYSSPVIERIGENDCFPAKNIKNLFVVNKCLMEI